MVIANVVVFSPTQPEGGVGSPGAGAEVEGAAKVSCPAGVVAIDGGCRGGGDRRRPVEVAARSSPGGDIPKVGAVAVLQHHRLGGGVAAIAPLLAVEGDGEIGDWGSCGVAEGQGKPAGYRT